MRYLELCVREDEEITLDSVKEEIVYIDTMIEETIQKLVSGWYDSEAKDPSEKMRARDRHELALEVLRDHRRELTQILFEIQRDKD